MNCKLEFLENRENGNLVSIFSFKKSAVKTYLELEIIHRQIQAMCNLFCFTTGMTEKDIISDIKTVKGEEVNFTIIKEDNKRDYETVFLSKKDRNKYFIEFDYIEDGGENPLK